LRIKNQESKTKNQDIEIQLFKQKPA